MLDMNDTRSDIIPSLDLETLRVRNLPSAVYDLLIDGQEVASYTRAELSASVNLAALKMTGPVKDFLFLINFMTCLDAILTAIFLR